MKIETGQATLRVDDFGEKYWSVADEGCRDEFDMNNGEAIEFNPEAFKEGTVIKIVENLG